MADTDPSQTLSELSNSLSRLETSLEPLLATPLDQLVQDAALDPLAQARLQVLASYVVHDLVWVYLKTAGVDPAAHPVMQEIERLKGYFGKLKAAQSGIAPASDAKPSRPRMQLDKAAANRFISAAINSNRARVDPNYTEADPMAIDDDDEAAAAEAGPSGTHIRFSEAEQEDVERLLEDKDLSDDNDDDEADDSDGVVEEMLRGAQPESAKESKVAPAAKSDPKKGKRKAMDPFAGYDQPKPATAAESKSTAASAAPAAPTKAAKRSPAKSATVTSEAAASEAPALSKKQRKKLKMKKDPAGGAK
ncbi:hypothetical protein BMF94_3152 [Rhodotorula taiwanensis]|uniref:Exosome complex protein n=1 Tax=Rhodotorula taiwanensis TaxID=741276 RepID=A0A2S5BA25_9BASI|nr:hypothetical protein BMF94_3152 [Rhodotorula taiwanensis]